jgi:GT2 family glycosyltransferase
MGFGGACQFGAMSAQADVYGFFNAHVRIDRHSVDRCTSAFDFEDVGIAAPYLYHPGTNNPVVDWKYTLSARRYTRILRLPTQVPSEDAGFGGEPQAALIDNEWATGGAIFCRMEVIRDIGWDGSYFLTFEDVDISIRARRSGWRVVVVPSAMAYHSGQSTRKASTSGYYSMRNALWFARKYHSRRIQALLTAYLLLRVCRMAAADVLRRRRPPRAMHATRGMLDGWRLWPKGMEALPGEPFVSSGA